MSSSCFCLTRSNQVSAGRMLSTILMLLLATGEGGAVFWQRLTCPLDPEQQNLPQVWCRQTSAHCCSGLTLGRGAARADGGRLRLSQDGTAFTVELLEAGQGGGVYWCGLLGQNHTIIKLAEGYMHGSWPAFVWSFSRWILLPLLPVATMLTHVRSVMRSRRRHEREDEPCDDVAAGGALTDPDRDAADSAEGLRN